jgi:hypothetical protein
MTKKVIALVLGLAAIAGCSDDTGNKTDAASVDTSPGTGGSDAAAAADANDAIQATDANDAGGDLVTISIECTTGIDIAIPCGALCNALDNNCTAADGNLQFSDFDTCVNLCLAPTWSCGGPGDQTGNTVFCRQSHAAAAATAADKAAECRNAGPNSTACH